MAEPMKRRRLTAAPSDEVSGAPAVMDQQLVPWETRFYQLQQFKAQFGHANPTFNVNQQNLVNQLASWLDHQRNHFNKGINLTPIQIQMLHGLGCYGFGVTNTHPMAAYLPNMAPPNGSHFGSYYKGPGYGLYQSTVASVEEKGTWDANLDAAAANDEEQQLVLDSSNGGQEEQLNFDQLFGDTTWDVSPPEEGIQSSATILHDGDINVTSKDALATSDAEWEGGDQPASIIKDGDVTWNSRCLELQALRQKFGHASPLAGTDLATWLKQQEELFQQEELPDYQVQALRDLGCRGFSKESRESQDHITDESIEDILLLGVDGDVPTEDNETEPTEPGKAEEKATLANNVALDLTPEATASLDSASLDPKLETAASLEAKPGTIAPPEAKPETTASLEAKPVATGPLDPKPETTASLEAKPLATGPLEPKPETSVSLDPKPETTTSLDPKPDTTTSDVATDSANNSPPVAQRPKRQRNPPVRHMATEEAKQEAPQVTKRQKTARRKQQASRLPKPSPKPDIATSAAPKPDIATSAATTSSSNTECNSDDSGQESPGDTTIGGRKVWDSKEPVPWWGRFKQLKAFKETHGHVNPSKSKSKPVAEQKLFAWLKNQRCYFRKGIKLTEEKIAMLQNLGCWGFDERQETRGQGRPRNTAPKEKLPPPPSSAPRRRTRRTSKEPRNVSAEDEKKPDKALRTRRGTMELRRAVKEPRKVSAEFGEKPESSTCTPRRRRGSKELREPCKEPRTVSEEFEEKQKSEETQESEEKQKSATERGSKEPRKPCKEPRVERKVSVESQTKQEGAPSRGPKELRKPCKEPRVEPRKLSAEYEEKQERAPRRGSKELRKPCKEPRIEPRRVSAELEEKQESAPRRGSKELRMLAQKEARKASKEPRVVAQETGEPPDCGSNPAANGILDMCARDLEVEPYQDHDGNPTVDL